MIKLVLILVSVILALAGIVYLFYRRNKDLKNELKQVRANIFELKNNIEVLKDYNKSRQHIIKTNDEIKKQIKEAKEDKDAQIIIDDMFNAWNSKLPTYTKTHDQADFTE